MLQGGAPIGPGFNPLARAMPVVGTPVFVTVQGTLEAPFILFGGKRVDLGRYPGLEPGKELTATLVQKNGVISLSLDDTPTSPVGQPATNTAPPSTTGSAPSPTPSMAPPVPSSPTPPPTPPAVGAMGNLMEALSRLGAKTDLARLLPPGAGDDASVRNLVALYRQAESLGPRLQQIQTTLAGVLSPGHPLFAALGAMLDDVAALQSGDTGRAARALRQLAERRGAESALAAGDASALAETDLPTLLERLRGLPGLRAALEQAGTLEEFLGATEEVLQRLDGARAQHLHGTVQGYVFLELPLPGGSGFQHAALHLFHEGEAQGAAAGAVPTVAVLDLDLEGLGPLWLELRALGGSCRCTVLAAEAGAERLLAAERGAFEAALGVAGFGQSQVHVGRWDGNRIARTGDLLAGFGPLDVQG